jgi:outer membrane murein-binding lipoprotein Lpp
MTDKQKAKLQAKFDAYATAISDINDQTDKLSDEFEKVSATYQKAVAKMETKLEALFAKQDAISEKIRTDDQ